MGDIQTGISWVDGQTVSAAQLNNMVNNAVIEPEFYSGRTTSIPVDTDSLLFYQASSDSLKRTSISKIVETGMPDAGTVAANRFLAGPATGSAQVPVYREITPADLQMSPVDLGVGLVIDWSLSKSFFRTLTGNPTFTFTNVNAGDAIIVALTQGGAGGFFPTFTGVSWEGGAAPTTWSTAVGKTDLIMFTRIAGKTCAWAKMGF